MQDRKLNELGRRIATRRVVQRQFLRAYESTMSLRRAAAVVSELGTPERSAKPDAILKRHYYWTENDPWYRRRFEIAYRNVCASIEDVATQRAVHGTERPVFHDGKIVGYETVYSDRLMELLLKGAMPAKYRDRRVDMQHAGEIEHKTTYVIHRAAPDALPEPIPAQDAEIVEDDPPA